MLAGLYVNYFRPRPDVDPIRKRVHKAHRKIWERIELKRKEKERIREHLEDTYRRLLAHPEGRLRVQQLITAKVPEFAQIVEEDITVEQFNILYLDYLDEEDILLMAASIL